MAYGKMAKMAFTPNKFTMQIPCIRVYKQLARVMQLTSIEIILTLYPIAIISTFAYPFNERGPNATLIKIHQDSLYFLIS
jgi:hypothetical protein